MELGGKNFSTTVWLFLALFFEVGSKTQFWYQFGINSAVRNDSIVICIVENWAFFVSEIYCHLIFYPKKSDALVEFTVNKTM